MSDDLLAWLTENADIWSRRDSYSFNSWKTARSQFSCHHIKWMGEIGHNFYDSIYPPELKSSPYIVDKDESDAISFRSFWIEESNSLDHWNSQTYYWRKVDAPWYFGDFKNLCIAGDE